ncbi:GNAT family N-acetyltransferase [Litoreibacter janthinus]|uniref:Acetyltransferase (GNAT) domain-containing protein n=1 Tax=Litoreibacter janthinus TaxID=670154 RepID=A0A1I6GKS6_9RHOB|nr:GNAT family N-acetyltransferase [Litoreibacter janthinus]SFR42788.1 Acetyltransferase (GNAT) domain-containing protein [Litoreibacter janthinus]
MSVRALTRADAEAFHALHIEGVSTFPTAFLRSLDEVRNTPLLDTERMLGSGKMLGAFSGETLIGLAGLAQNDFAMARHRALLGPFYVSQNFHGQGVAQALMDAVFERAHDLGILQIELFVWSENLRAQRFYLRNGFEQTGVIPRSVIVDGVPCDDFFMVRALDR